jgi:hypothetical protein
MTKRGRICGILSRKRSAHECAVTTHITTEGRSCPHTIAETFSRLLREIPAGTSLPEWQHLYRQAIFSMGLQILELFPKDAVGPDPSAPGSSGGVAPPPGNTNPVIYGQGPGTHPNSITELAQFVLCMQSNSTKKPGK